MNIPSTFLSKYIYGINNPVVFSDPSGMSILSGVIDAFLQAGHDFIATFGAGLDNFIKSDIGFIIIVIGLGFATPGVTLGAIITSGVQASYSGDWSWGTFKKNFAQNYATSLALNSVLGTQSSLFDIGAPISLIGAGASLGTAIYMEHYKRGDIFDLFLPVRILFDVDQIADILRKPFPSATGY